MGQMLAATERASGAKGVGPVFAVKQGALEAGKYAHGVWIEALRLEGDFLKAQPVNTGAKGLGTSSAVTQCDRTRPATLKDQGIGKRESVQAKAVASLAVEKPNVFGALKREEVLLTKVSREVQRKEAAKGRQGGYKPPAGNCRKWVSARRLVAPSRNPFPLVFLKANGLAVMGGQDNGTVLARRPNNQLSLVVGVQDHPISLPEALLSGNRFRPSSIFPS